MLKQAIQLYRENFEPSEYLSKPYVSMGVPTVVAETDAEAEYLATSAYQRVLGLHARSEFKVKAPIASMDGLWSPAEKMSVEGFMPYSNRFQWHGKEGLKQLLLEYDVDNSFSPVTSMTRTNV